MSLVLAILEMAAGYRIGDVEATGAYSGQVDGTIRAYSPSGSQIGYLDWSKYQGDILIKMVSVDPEHRMKGIASALIKKLEQEFPDDTLKWGYMTSGGYALKQAYDAR